MSIILLISKSSLYFRAVCREFGIQIGRLWLIFQLFSPGMFIASTAFLPSSFAMYFCSAALAAWWHQKYNLAVYFVAIAALLGKFYIVWKKIILGKFTEDYLKTHAGQTCKTLKC